MTGDNDPTVPNNITTAPTTHLPSVVTEPTTAGPTHNSNNSRTARKRRHLVILATLGAIVVVAGGVVFLQRQSSNNDEKNALQSSTNSTTIGDDNNATATTVSSPESNCTEDGSTPDDMDDDETTLSPTNDEEIINMTLSTTPSPTTAPTRVPRVASAPTPSPIMNNSSPPLPTVLGVTEFPTPEQSNNNNNITNNISDASSSSTNTSSTLPSPTMSPVTTTDNTTTTGNSTITTDDETAFPTLSPAHITDFPTAYPTTLTPTLTPTTAFPTWRPISSPAPTTRQWSTLLNRLRTVLPTTTNDWDDSSSALFRAAQWIYTSVQSSGTTVTFASLTGARLRRTVAVLALDIGTLSDTAREPGQGWKNTRFAQQLNVCGLNGVTCGDNQAVQRILWSDAQNKVRTGRLSSAALQALSPSLVELDLGEQKLRGSLPDGLYECTALRKLYLHSNLFTGTLSTNVTGWKDRMQNLYLGDNRLSGTIPPTLGSFRSLRYLTLHRNKFEGTIPTQQRWTSLYYLDLGWNELEGQVPASWYEGDNTLNELRHLYLSHNRFTGTLPDAFTDIGNMRLRQLYINDNQFSGLFPGAWDPYNNMEQLRLQHNNFSAYGRRVCQLQIYGGGETTGFVTDCRLCSCGRPFCRTPRCFT